MRFLKYFLFLLLLNMLSANLEHSGQLMWQFDQPDKEKLSASARYLPEFTYSLPEYNLDFNFRLNARAATETDSRTKIHRLWARYNGEQLEIRAGLQQLDFGPAMLFRPLQWFDSIDPLDPLGFTEGVQGMLVRYYFPNNANFWLWGLVNNELKGTEIIPTAKNRGEFGGRLQVPVFNGEAGLTYHQRQMDFGQSPTFSIFSQNLAPEERFGLDGKWDIGIGFWLEAAQISARTDIADFYPEKQYQSTIGVDYTFAIGNGLHVLVEKFNLDTKLEADSKAINSQVYGIMADYPLSLYDTVSLAQYYAEKNDSLSLQWRRTYDNLLFQFGGTVLPDYSDKNKTTGILQAMISYNY